MAINISNLTIKAPKQKVWEAITNPIRVKQWQLGSELVTDWKVGSEIRFRTPWNGRIIEQWGKVLEVRRGELVRYSLFAPRPGLDDKPENYFVMVYSLTEADGVTLLEIRQEDNRPVAIQAPPQGEENPVLKALKEVAEAL